MVPSDAYEVGPAEGTMLAPSRVLRRSFSALSLASSSRKALFST